MARGRLHTYEFAHLRPHTHEAGHPSGLGSDSGLGEEYGRNNEKGSNSHHRILTGSCGKSAEIQTEADIITPESPDRSSRCPVPLFVEYDSDGKDHLFGIVVPCCALLLCAYMPS